jgi:hypothetical protein
VSKTRRAHTTGPATPARAKPSVAESVKQSRPRPTPAEPITAFRPKPRPAEQVTPSGSTATAAEPLEPPGWWPLGELALRAAATLVATWAGLLLAIFGVFLTPLRIGGVPVPASLVLAVGGNAVLIWLTWLATRHRLLAMIPGFGWIVVALIASSSTREGDVPLAGNSWVALAFLVLGAMTVAVAGYRLMLRGPQRRPDVPGPRTRDR